MYRFTGNCCYIYSFFFLYFFTLFLYTTENPSNSFAVLMQNNTILLPPRALGSKQRLNSTNLPISRGLLLYIYTVFLYICTTLFTTNKPLDSVASVDAEQTQSTQPSFESFALTTCVGLPATDGFDKNTDLMSASTLNFYELCRSVGEEQHKPLD